MSNDFEEAVARLFQAASKGVGEGLKGSISWTSNVTHERPNGFKRSSAFTVEVYASHEGAADARIASTVAFGHLSLLAAAIAVLEYQASEIDKSTQVDTDTARDAWKRAVQACVQTVVDDSHFKVTRVTDETVIEGPAAPQMGNPSVTFSSDCRSNTLPTERAKEMLAVYRANGFILLGENIAPGLKILDDYAEEYSA